MRKRKWFLFPALLVLVFALTGCGRNTDEIQVMRIWEKDGEAVEDGVSSKQAGDGSSIKIGMETNLGGIDDESFNQSAWEGLQNLALRENVEVTYIETQELEDIPQNLRTLVDDNCKLIWGIGYLAADDLKASALENPDVHFALVDSSYEETPANVTGVVFRGEEPSFLVGFIAGSVTKNGKVGFVGGIESDVVNQFRYGFEAGVAYASETYGKNVEVTSEYVQSFTEPEKGKEIAEKMYASGCDVIFHAAGGSGTGVIEAAKETNHFVIGVDRDQSYLAPANVLTSALKNVNVAVERVSLSYVRGEEVGGKTLSLGLAEGAAGIPEDHANYRDEIYDAVLLIEDKIKSGEIVPPATAEAYDLYINSLENTGE